MPFAVGSGGDESMMDMADAGRIALWEAGPSGMDPVEPESSGGRRSRGGTGWGRPPLSPRRPSPRTRRRRFRIP